MLLFVRKYYVEEIRAGRKLFEIRAGLRYRNVHVGDVLSINGQFRLTVTQVDVHDRESIKRALPDWARDVDACYPDHNGPFYVFWFKAPPAAVGLPPVA